MSLNLLFVINSLFCFGLRMCSEDGMIFERLRLWMEHYTSPLMHKPLISCCMCMASIYGTIFVAYWCTHHGVQHLPERAFTVLIYDVCLVGANAIIWHLYMVMLKFIKR